ncbi:MAG TPA: WGxxGxxG family protein [Thermomicrobiales bacterium]|nr:WGxxGxxG family protein [Thermomicrobiales bacterium]
MRLMIALRTVLVAALLTLGLVAVAPAVAQDDATEVVDETTEQAEEVTDEVQEESEGFDDWGLLGLLGLAGLAGLMRRPQPVVHETERPTRRVDNTGL